MIAFHPRIWDGFQSVRSKLKSVSKLDILTGFLGKGACNVLEAIGATEVRLVFGLDCKAPMLAPAQIEELHRLKKYAAVRVCSALHAKLYLFDDRYMVIGSANFTQAGFERLLEANLILNDVTVIRKARGFFEGIWRMSTPIEEIIERIQPLTENMANEGERGLGEAHQHRTSPFGKPTQSPERPRRVRISAYRVSYLDELETVDETEWTSGEGVQLGDVQLFCFSTDLTNAEELRDDPRVDAAHSLWEALGPIHRVPDNPEWPRQADFKLLVRLKEPVPKADFIAARVLKVPRWPQGSNGKLLHTEAEVRKLADVLSRRNPSQRALIYESLGC